MNKEVKKLVISVIITIILCLVSIPLWEIQKRESQSLLAESYGNLSISVNLGQIPNLLIVEDDRVDEYLDYTPVTFRNPNAESKAFGVYFLYDKSSTIDYKDIVISIGGNIYHLNDIEPIEADGNYYFKLVDCSLGAYSDKTYQVKIWLDENTKLTEEEMILITNFIAR